MQYGLKEKNCLMNAFKYCYINNVYEFGVFCDDFYLYSIFEYNVPKSILHSIIETYIIDKQIF